VDKELSAKLSQFNPLGFLDAGSRHLHCSLLVRDAILDELLFKPRSGAAGTPARAEIVRCPPQPVQASEPTKTATLSILICVTFRAFYSF
jgi:hypothetical protein